MGVANTLTTDVWISIDDDWLEAVLENLALANLSRSEAIKLASQLEHLESLLESSQTHGPLDVHHRGAVTEVVVGERFVAAVNEYGMRSPETMTASNVLEAILYAAHQFVVGRHAKALSQLVLFVCVNLDEVVDDENEEGD